MGRFSKFSRESEDETKVDISPLIDCVFILLIFFIVTTTFVEEKGIASEKAQPSDAPSDASESDAVTIVLPGKKQVLLNGDVVTVGEVRKRVRNAVKKNPETPITIKAVDGVPLSFMTRIRDEVNLGGGKMVSYDIEKGGR